MIVEFLGIQGSGKTSLVSAVIEYLRENGILARTVVEAARPYAQRTLLGKVVGWIGPPSIRQPLLWQIYYSLSVLHRLSFFAKHSKLLLYVLSTQRARPGAAGVREKRVLFWFFHLAGGYDFLVPLVRPDEALVFDDGFVHRVVHLNASETEVPDPVKIAAYLDLIPLPQILIVPLVPVDVCVERVQARGVWDHFQGKTTRELRQYLTNTSFIVNTAVEYLKSKDLTVIEVDNGHNELSATIAELQEKLEHLPALVRS